MAPKGITIDLLPPADGAHLRALLPEARTAVRFLSGKCGCDFFVQRDPVAHREESELRRRWRKLGMNRQAILAATDRHRRPPATKRAPEAWQQAIAAFVAEHLRNAGPTLYLHQFSGDGHVHPAAEATEIELETVLQNAASWLLEGAPVIVVRDRAA